MPLCFCDLFDRCLIFLRVFRPIIAFSILFFAPPCFLTFDFTQFSFVFVAATGSRKVGGSRGI